MLKKTLLIGLIALPAYAAPIHRVGEIDAPGFGRVQVEIIVSESATGKIGALRSEWDGGDIDDYNRGMCRTSTSFTGNEVQFIVKNYAGVELGRKIQALSLEAQENGGLASQASDCPTYFDFGNVHNFYHPDEFVDFSIPTANGSKKLSLSVFLSGNLHTSADGRFVATIDPTSIHDVRWFAEGYQGGSSSSLRDPSKPVAPAAELPTDPDRWNR